MALLPNVSPTQAGTAAAYSAASAGGDTMVPSDRTHLHVKNGSGGSITVTVVAKTACNHGVLHNLAVAVPAGEERLIGAIIPSRFARPADGLAEITYSDVTTLTVAAVKS